ncbi:MAG: Rieske 2Fe-2S domain-containing protein, partial [Afipia sp.]|nr:Rieske 2Fe-2S domain-containing protein [Afipia sp.]
MSAIIDKARDLDHLLATAVQDDKEAGIFRCRRDIFTNEDLFELEMKHIFESNWVYLAHESQIPENNDYYTTYIGRQPVVITRDKTGELNAVINA